MEGPGEARQQTSTLQQFPLPAAGGLSQQRTLWGRFILLSVLIKTPVFESLPRTPRNTTESESHCWIRAAKGRLGCGCHRLRGRMGEVPRPHSSCTDSTGGGAGVGDNTAGGGRQCPVGWLLRANTGCIQGVGTAALGEGSRVPVPQLLGCCGLSCWGCVSLFCSSLCSNPPTFRGSDVWISPVSQCIELQMSH